MSNKKLVSAATTYSPSKVGMELADRILFVVLVLIVYRVGSYVPIPGIDVGAIGELTNRNAGGILGMVNMLSGGSLGRMSIFALAIMPYITASIVIQVMTTAVPALEALKKEGGGGRVKINQYTRYLTVFLALFQGLGVSSTVEGLDVLIKDGYFFHHPYIFRMVAVLTLACGTMLLMWLGEQISSKGVGSGTSLIIFSGIVAGFPNAVVRMFELSRTGVISTFFAFQVMLFVGLMVFIVVFVEKSYRKLLVQYPKSGYGAGMQAPDSSHLPLKINTAGVIPPIFASSILLFPLTIANFSASTGKGGVGEFWQKVSYNLSHGRPVYILLYTVLIVFFCFFYTSIVFNTTDTANNLKKYGGVIPGKRPGEATASYLDYILTRLTVLGAAYIAFICIIPEVLISHYSVPFYLGGTSVLIVVNVIIDTMTQLQTHFYARKYEGLMNKSRLRIRRK
jgi:preprotein translocase subunit SecY